MARHIVATAVLLGGSLLVAFGILELLLRAIYPPPNRFLFPQEFYDFDPETEHVLRPGQTASTQDHPVRINSLAYARVRSSKNRDRGSCAFSRWVGGSPPATRPPRTASAGCCRRPQPRTRSHSSATSSGLSIAERAGRC